MGVPKYYAQWWYAEMEARDWRKVDGSAVGNHNWRPVLKSWHNRDLKDTNHLQEIRNAYEPKVVAPVSFAPEDWELCAERCAHCRNGTCAKGVKVPPAKDQPPFPPEECKGFEIEVK